MTKEELKGLLEARGFPGDLTDTWNFDKVNFVYENSPTLNGPYREERFADLIGKFGKQIIEDLYPRAARYYDLQAKLDTLERQEKTLRADINLYLDGDL